MSQRSRSRSRSLCLFIVAIVIALIILVCVMCSPKKPENFEDLAPLIIITPIRDREEHLNKLVNAYKKVLNEQKVPYKIYAIEQEQGYKFNKGILLNIGFLEAQKDYPVSDIFVLNDVDNFPMITDALDFRKLKSGIEHLFGYRYVLNGIFSIDKDTYEKANGFSNEFWGWGSEDVDFTNRIDATGIHVRHDQFYNRHLTKKIHDEDSVIKNPVKSIFDHSALNNLKIKDKKNESYKKDPNNVKVEGLNTTKYEILNRDDNDLYTRILVSLI